MWECSFRIDFVSLLYVCMQHFFFFFLINCQMKKLLLKLILLLCIIRFIFKLTVTLCKDKQFCNVKQQHYSWVLIKDYGRPIKSFFIKIQKFWTLADKLKGKNLKHLGYFWPNFQHPFWYHEFFVHVFRYSTIISTKS